MKLRVRLLSALLAASLLGSMSAPALAASPPEPLTGSITATLRIDYAQSLSALQSRNVQVELLRDGKSLGSLPLAEVTSAASLGGFPAAVSARNSDGGSLGGGQWPGWLELSVQDLPQGSYALRFTGRGYTTYTQDIPLGDCNRHLILGTGDATFTLGDVNGDNKVNEQDRSALSKALGSTRSEDLETCDLNGDGKIDIIDLAYINRQLAAQGSAECLETSLLAPPVDTAAALAGLAEQDITVTGDLDSLFQPGGAGVKLEAEGDIQLTLPLTKEIEISELQITAPDGSGSPLKGSVLVEDSKGNQIAIPFDHTVPEGPQATGATPGKNVITIKLGKRVPVKKVTITVTQTEGGSFAVLETIEFLKDIVPENPVAPYSTVSNIRTEPGNESVSLRWDELPNVSGYRVRYWLQGSSNAAQELRVDVPQATVTGLENLKTYVFTITPIDGSWEGSPSEEVTAAPQPSGPPDRVDMVSVSPLDGQLAVSWKAAKSALYYKVFYQEKGASQWQQAGGDLVQTSVTISGLTNGVTYSIYVTAWNDSGEGPKSAIAEGTPKETDYSRPEGIPVDSLLDASLIESVKLADPKNYLASAYTADKPFVPENMIDNDYRTHWTASNNWNGNEHVEVTFKEPVDLSAVIWVPRLDGRYPTFLRAYSVQVWYEGEDLSQKGHLLVPDPNRGGQDNGGGGGDVHTWPAIPNQGTIPSDRFAIMPFDPAENVVKISVAAEQTGYDGHNVSCSELMFVRYDPTKNLVDEIGNLFEGGKDGLHDALVSGVTAERITELENRLQAEKNYYFNTDVLADELALARELLNGSTSGAVLHGIESRSGAADSKYSQGGSVFQPLGVTAQAGKDITIYVSGIPEGETVTVYATQYNSEVSGWQASMGTLHNGRNILRVPTLENRAEMSKGGSLYLTYGGGSPDSIKLHVRRGIDIPVLELSNWYKMDEEARKNTIGAYVDELDAYLTRTNISSPQTDYRNVTEISTPVVLLSLPAAAVKSALGQSGRDGKIDTIYQTVLAWEDIMHICKTTQGIDSTYDKNDMQTRQNIRCMTMFSGAFMYAAGNHIGIGYGSCGGMVTGRPVDKDNPAWPNGLFGWGIAHEIGHNMDKLGKAEITNNIYSLMVQTCDGTNNTGTSRLEASNKYAAMFNKTAQGDPGAAGDVFVQLGLYWQLHLAYDGAENDEHGPMWFYNQFFKAWKAGTYTGGAASYDDKVALTASGVVQKDLTKFFTRWGMTLSDSTKNTLKGYGAEDRAVWYLNDQSRRDRLNGVAAGAGTVTAQAQKTGDRSVELTFSTALAAGKVQGYEILRNGQSIAFVIADEKGGTYTDVIGSGNHRTYTYEVAAYDTLGNRIGAAAGTGTIRIAYDKTVDESLYTTGERSADGTVVITMKEKTPVTGLKLTGGDVLTGGAFAAVVQVDGKSIPARSGAWDEAHNLAADDKDSFVTYFQKPGAEESDTRIWTYSPETITVTNVPENAKIELISFAGDDVAFLESETGAVGRLAADYSYTDENGAEQIIPKDTLVILGTYRGDPVYNTVKIKGIFQTSSINEAGEAVETDSVERYLDGYALLFAEVPEDGEVSDISDGIFIFVPNVQKEAELQGKDGEQNCHAENLLPSRIQAVLSRTDLPDSADSQRISAESAWINSPGGSGLPIVVLE
ncbi:MAG: hypothetical protein HFF18_09615 [Oscillospiraceae bacterium]|nr:hypothetical protein [Oscillospiraceae bacterium]